MKSYFASGGGPLSKVVHFAGF